MEALPVKEASYASAVGAAVAAIHSVMWAPVVSIFSFSKSSQIFRLPAEAPALVGAERIAVFSASEIFEV